LALHAGRRLLQIQVSDAVSVEVIDLLEAIEVNVDEPEDGGLLAGLVDLRVQGLVEGEAVVDVGEQIELGAAAEIGIEMSGLDGQGGESNSHGEGLGLDVARFGERIECGK
jgi:hypothetical protein